MPVLSISNFVATGHLNQNVKLDLIGKLKYVIFDSNAYPCAYVKTPKMFAKVSVFRTGKMISVGSKSELQAKHDLLETSRYLAKNGIIKWKEPGFKIQNIVMVGEINAKYDLNELYRTLGNSIFEPEQFPGIIHHPMPFPKISILFFQSGKCVVAGIRSPAQIGDVQHYLQTIEKHLQESL